MLDVCKIYQASQTKEQNFNLFFKFLEMQKSFLQYQNISISDIKDKITITFEDNSKIIFLFNSYGNLMYQMYNQNGTRIESSYSLSYGFVYEIRFSKNGMFIYTCNGTTDARANIIKDSFFITKNTEGGLVFIQIRNFSDTAPTAILYLDISDFKNETFFTKQYGNKHPFSSGYRYLYLIPIFTSEKTNSYIMNSYIYLCSENYNEDYYVLNDHVYYTNGVFVLLCD